MITYAATFTTGFTKTVEEKVKKTFRNCEIELIEDGIVIFKTAEILNNINIAFLNNIYYVMDYANVDSEDEYNKCLATFVKKIRIDYSVLKQFIKSSTDCKLINIDKNQPVSINFKIIEPLEKHIGTSLGLKINRRNPRNEFVFLRRRENIFIFMLKISSNRTTDKDLEKGELRPELCNLTISQINLDGNSIVMDPFCGHGGIPKEIIRNFKYSMCFASDIDAQQIDKLKNQFKNNKKKLYIKQRDALNLEYFEDNFIDAVITDPPWNIYDEKNIDFKVFYLDMLNELKRIVKDNGDILIIMGNKTVFEEALKQCSKLSLENKIDTLVNGKKASIYCIKKHIK